MRTGEKKFCGTMVERFCAARMTMPASEWVERNVRLNEPKIKGQFSLRGREYLREILDSWGPLPESLKGSTDYAACMGTGSGKTIGTIGGLAYRIKNDP